LWFGSQIYADDEGLRGLHDVHKLVAIFRQPKRQTFAEEREFGLPRKNSGMFYHPVKRKSFGAFLLYIPAYRNVIY
jgi:hypothetical protein